MIIEGTFTFDGPRDVVWNLLQDPAVLAKALPGAQRLEQTSDGTYEGEMRVGIGPVSAAAFSVTVTLSDRVEPERYSMQIDGKGGVGFARGTAQVVLTESGGGTDMRYTADLKIGGKIAGIGQRVLDAASKTMTRQGLDALNRELQARLGAAPAPARFSPRVVVAGALAVAVVVLLLVWFL